MEPKIRAEMIVHIPLCAHPEPKYVAIIGQASSFIDDELSKHNVDIKYFNSLSSDFLAPDNLYDVILVCKETFLNQDFLQNIDRVLAKNGIVVYESLFYKNNLEIFKDHLGMFGEFFWIVMGYNFDENSVIFASKKYHPTADLILQKSDLLDNLYYYSSEIHLSSFVFPNFYHKKFTNIMKR